MLCLCLRKIQELLALFFSSGREKSLMIPKVKKLAQSEASTPLFIHQLGCVWVPNMQNSPLACSPSPEASLHLPVCTHRHQPAYKGRSVCSQRYWAKTIIWFSNRQVTQTECFSVCLFELNQTLNCTIYPKAQRCSV